MARSTLVLALCALLGELGCLGPALGPGPWLPLLGLRSRPHASHAHIPGG